MNDKRMQLYVNGLTGGREGLKKDSTGGGGGGGGGGKKEEIKELSNVQ